MTGIEPAVRKRQYELAALRLLLGVTNVLEQSAPRAREELVHLLTFDPLPEAARRSRTRATNRGGRTRPGRA